MYAPHQYSSFPAMSLVDGIKWQPADGSRLFGTEQQAGPYKSTSLPFAISNIATSATSANSSTTKLSDNGELLAKRIVRTLEEHNRNYNTTPVTGENSKSSIKRHLSRPPKTMISSGSRVTKRSYLQLGRQLNEPQLEIDNYDDQVVLPAQSPVYRPSQVGQIYPGYQRQQQHKNLKPVHVSISQQTVNGLLSLLLLFIISICGCIGAIFIMSALTLVESLQTRGNCYLVSLAMSHLIVALFVIPSSALQIMAGDGGISGQTLCHYQWLTLEFSLIVSQLTFMLIAADNYLGYCCSEKVVTSVAKSKVEQQSAGSDHRSDDNAKAIASAGATVGSEVDSDRALRPFSRCRSRIGEEEDRQSAMRTHLTDSRDPHLISLQREFMAQTAEVCRRGLPAGYSSSDVSDNEDNLLKQFILRLRHNHPIRRLYRYLISKLEDREAKEELDGKLSWFVSSPSHSRDVSPSGRRCQEVGTAAIRQPCSFGGVSNEAAAATVATDSTNRLSASNTIKTTLLASSPSKLGRLAHRYAGETAGAKLKRPGCFSYRNCCGRLRVLAWIACIWASSFAYVMYQHELSFTSKFCSNIAPSGLAAPTAPAKPGLTASQKHQSNYKRLLANKEIPPLSGGSSSRPDWLVPEQTEAVASSAHPQVERATLMPSNLSDNSIEAEAAPAAAEAARSSPNILNLSWQASSSAIGTGQPSPELALDDESAPVPKLIGRRRINGRAAATAAAAAAAAATEAVQRGQNEDAEGKHKATYQVVIESDDDDRKPVSEQSETPREERSPGEYTERWRRRQVRLGERNRMTQSDSINGGDKPYGWLPEARGRRQLDPFSGVTVSHVAQQGQSYPYNWEVAAKTVRRTKAELKPILEPEQGGATLAERKAREVTVRVDLAGRYRAESGESGELDSQIGSIGTRRQMDIGFKPVASRSLINKGQQKFDFGANREKLLCNKTSSITSTSTNFRISSNNSATTSSKNNSSSSGGKGGDDNWIEHEYLDGHGRGFARLGPPSASLHSQASDLETASLKPNMARSEIFLSSANATSHYGDNRFEHSIHQVQSEIENNGSPKTVPIAPGRDNAITKSGNFVFDGLASKAALNSSGGRSKHTVITSSLQPLQMDRDFKAALPHGAVDQPSQLRTSMVEDQLTSLQSSLPRGSNEQDKMAATRVRAEGEQRHKSKRKGESVPNQAPLVRLQAAGRQLTASAHYFPPIQSLSMQVDGNSHNSSDINDDDSNGGNNDDNGRRARELGPEKSGFSSASTSATTPIVHDNCQTSECARGSNKGRVGPSQEVRSLPTTTTVAALVAIQEQLDKRDGDEYDYDELNDEGPVVPLLEGTGSYSRVETSVKQPGGIDRQQVNGESTTQKTSAPIVVSSIVMGPVPPQVKVASDNNNYNKAKQWRTSTQLGGPREEAQRSGSTGGPSGGNGRSLHRVGNQHPLKAATLCYDGSSCHRNKQRIGRRLQRQQQQLLLRIDKSEPERGPEVAKQVAISSSPEPHSADNNERSPPRSSSSSLSLAWHEDDFDHYARDRGSQSHPGLDLGRPKHFHSSLYDADKAAREPLGDNGQVVQQHEIDAQVTKGKIKWQTADSSRLPSSNLDTEERLRPLEKLQQQWSHFKEFNWKLQSNGLAASTTAVHSGGVEESNINYLGPLEPVTEASTPSTTTTTTATTEITTTTPASSDDDALVGSLTADDTRRYLHELVEEQASSSSLHSSVVWPQHSLNDGRRETSGKRATLSGPSRRATDRSLPAEIKELEVVVSRLSGSRSKSENNGARLKSVASADVGIDEQQHLRKSLQLRHSSDEMQTALDLGGNSAVASDDENKRQSESQRDRARRATQLTTASSLLALSASRPSKWSKPLNSIDLTNGEGSYVDDRRPPPNSAGQLNLLSSAVVGDDQVAYFQSSADADIRPSSAYIGPAAAATDPEIGPSLSNLDQVSSHSDGQQHQQLASEQQLKQEQQTLAEQRKRRDFYWPMFVGSILMPSFVTTLLFVRAYLSMKEFKTRPYKPVPVATLASTPPALLTPRSPIPLIVQRQLYTFDYPQPAGSSLPPPPPASSQTFTATTTARTTTTQQDLPLPTTSMSSSSSQSMSTALQLARDNDEAAGGTKYRQHKLQGTATKGSKSANEYSSTAQSLDESQGASVASDARGQYDDVEASSDTGAQASLQRPDNASDSRDTDNSKSNNNDTDNNDDGDGDKSADSDDAGELLARAANETARRLSELTASDRSPRKDLHLKRKQTIPQAGVSSGATRPRLKRAWPTTTASTAVATTTTTARSRVGASTVKNKHYSLAESSYANEHEHSARAQLNQVMSAPVGGSTQLVHYAKRPSGDARMVSAFSRLKPVEPFQPGLGPVTMPDGMLQNRTPMGANNSYPACDYWQMSHANRISPPMAGRRSVQCQPIELHLQQQQQALIISGRFGPHLSDGANATLTAGPLAPGGRRPLMQGGSNQEGSFSAPASATFIGAGVGGRGLDQVLESEHPSGDHNELELGHLHQDKYEEQHEMATEVGPEQLNWLAAAGSRYERQHHNNSPLYYCRPIRENDIDGNSNEQIVESMQQKQQQQHEYQFSRRQYHAHSFHYGSTSAVSNEYVHHYPDSNVGGGSSWLGYQQQQQQYESHPVPPLSWSVPSPSPVLGGHHHQQGAGFRIHATYSMNSRRRKDRFAAVNYCARPQLTTTTENNSSNNDNNGQQQQRLQPFTSADGAPDGQGMVLADAEGSGHEVSQVDGMAPGSQSLSAACTAIAMRKALANVIRSVDEDESDNNKEYKDNGGDNYDDDCDDCADDEDLCSDRRQSGFSGQAQSLQAGASGWQQASSEEPLAQVQQARSIRSATSSTINSRNDEAVSNPPLAMRRAAKPPNLVNLSTAVGAASSIDAAQDDYGHYDDNLSSKRKRQLEGSNTRYSGGGGGGDKSNNKVILCTYSYMTDDQLLKSNIIVFAVNWFLWFPFILLLIVLQYRETITSDYKNFVWWLAILNCCSCSYVYALTNKDFREAFNKLFFYCCCKSHVTFQKKTPIFRRQLDIDSSGNLRVHIIPGLNVYSNKLSGLAASMASSGEPFLGTFNANHYHQHQPQHTIWQPHFGQHNQEAPNVVETREALQQPIYSFGTTPTHQSETCITTQPKRSTTSVLTTATDTYGSGSQSDRRNRFLHHNRNDNNTNNHEKHSSDI